MLASTIHGKNCTPSSSLNNCGMPDITQHMNSSPSAIQRRSIGTPSATLGTTSYNSAAPGGISQTDSTHHIEFSPAYSIASTPTSLSDLENQPTTIPYPEAHMIITD
jgi:hypothetical protein